MRVHAHGCDAACAHVRQVRDGRRSRTFPSSARRLFRRHAVGVDRRCSVLVLVGTYVGLGALAHDFGFTRLVADAVDDLIWAAPAQVILISALGTGAALLEVALARDA